MNTTSPTTATIQLAAEAQRLLAELKEALRQEESVTEIEYQITQVAAEFDSISEQYEDKLSDLHDEKHRITRNAESKRQEFDRLKHRLPLDAEDQQRVAELREQLQRMKRDYAEVHQALDQERHKYQILEREIASPNRRPLPDDEETLRVGRLALREANEATEQLRSQIRHTEWQIDFVFEMNLKTFLDMEV